MASGTCRWTTETSLNRYGGHARPSIGLPAWVQVDASKLEGVFKKTPDRDEFGADIKEALIVELYSR